MKTTKFDLTIKFTSSILGTMPQRDIAVEHILSKVADDGGECPPDEVATLSGELEKGTTAFHRLEDKPIAYDYQVKGFLKNAAQVFNGKSGNPKNFRSKVNNTVFVSPRQIQYELPEGAEIGICTRPLRAETAQGPRVAIARSEEIPAGASIKCQVTILDGEITEKHLRGLLDYGQYIGLGQWRNGGHGSFEYTLEEVA